MTTLLTGRSNFSEEARMRKPTSLPTLSAVLMMAVTGACGSDVETGTPMSATCDSSSSTCIVVGIYGQESDGSYTDRDKDLTFTVGATCQVWSRLAPADSHSDDSHLHYNAHRDSTYDNGTFTWFEYGPEISQADIDATCAAGSGGAEKTANETDYIADKNFFVRIKSVTP